MPNVMPIYLPDVEQARLQHCLPTMPRGADRERTRRRRSWTPFSTRYTSLRTVGPTSENQVTVPCALATSLLMRSVQRVHIDLIRCRDPQLFHRGQQGTHGFRHDGVGVISPRRDACMQVQRGWRQSGGSEGREELYAQVGSAPDR